MLLSRRQCQRSQHSLSSLDRHRGRRVLRHPPRPARQHTCCSPRIPSQSNLCWVGWMAPAPSPTSWTILEPLDIRCTRLSRLCHSPQTAPSAELIMRQIPSPRFIMRSKIPLTLAYRIIIIKQLYTMFDIMEAWRTAATQMDELWCIDIRH